MRIAALYDIHGNAPALEAVLTEVQRHNVGLIVVGGDCLAGPLPNECLALLRGVDVPIEWIWGNHESDVLTHLAGEEVQGLSPKAAETARWVAERLDLEAQQFVKTWQLTKTIDTDKFGRIVFCHATPQNNLDVFSRLTPDDEARAIIGPTDADIVVCGHTHMQFDRQLGDLRVINAGSVGMPFGDSGAFWLLIGDEIDLRNTDYDRVQAAEQIRVTTYPGAEAFAEGNVLTTPTEEAALGFMEQIAERQRQARNSAE